MPTPDSTTKYAERVASGKLVACESIRWSAKRHLDEYRATGLPYWFDADRAWRALAFFRRLTVPEGRSRYMDNGKPRKLKLFDWQEFMIGSIAGWRMYHEDFPDKEVRRFLEVVLMTARGSGKSPILAGLMLWHLLEDDEPQPRGHLITSKTSQGQYVWDPLQTMVEDAQTEGNLFTHSTRERPGRRERVRDEPIILDFIGGRSYATEMSLYVRQGGRGGSIKLVSGESSGRGATGANSSLILCDEMHDLRTDDLLDRYLSGRKERLQPLFIVTTNAGDSDLTPYGRMYRRLCKDIKDDAVHPRTLRPLPNLSLIHI